MPAASIHDARHAPLLERLCARAEQAAAEFGGVSRARFVAALERSAARRFPSGASPAEVAAFLESLHLPDLALACACADASEPAWEHFIRRFRPDLYAAARALCPKDEAAARDLADSLYAELFGLRGEGAERRSLFDYFHGRSSLSTWLRAVLAQRRVDGVRAARREEPLDETSGEESAALPRGPHSAGPQDPHRERYLALLQAALAAALAALEPRERLRLACYYLRDMTLAEIGRTLGEHEATVSRHLERTRRRLRSEVEHALRRRERLSDAQVTLCFEYATSEWPFDLSRALTAPDAREPSG